MSKVTDNIETVEGTAIPDPKKYPVLFAQFAYAAVVGLVLALGIVIPAAAVAAGIPVVGVAVVLVRAILGKATSVRR